MLIHLDILTLETTGQIITKTINVATKESKYPLSTGNVSHLIIITQINRETAPSPACMIKDS